MATEWETIVLDADPPTGELASMTAGDNRRRWACRIGERRNERPLWYRPDTRERGSDRLDPHHGGRRLHDVTATAFWRWRRESAKAIRSSFIRQAPTLAIRGHAR